MTMKRYRHYPILSFLLLTLSSGCGLITPSHHRTEDYTPVVAAATAGDLNTVREAVHSDPTLVKYKEWDNATLLHDAVGQNHMDVAKYLLEEGADVNAVKTDGVTPLHMAARNGNTEMTKLLLERGAKIDAIDAKGWTPLDRAQKWGHQDTAEFLRQQGGHEGTAARESPRRQAHCGAVVLASVPGADDWQRRDTALSRRL
jgi:ankyrin repeat protein